MSTYKVIKKKEVMVILKIEDPETKNHKKEAYMVDKWGIAKYRESSTDKEKKGVTFISLTEAITFCKKELSITRFIKKT